MTLAATAILQADLRFRGAPLDVRGLYRMLLDFEDACGDVCARGLDGVGAAAAALGCSREEAQGVLTRMEAHGLVKIEAQRVCLMVGSKRGKRGGASPAERQQNKRARKAEEAKAKTEAPAAPPATTDVTAGHGSVTGESRAQVLENTAETQIGHGCVLDASNPDRDSVAPPSTPPGSLPFPLSPAPPLSLTLSPAPPPPSPADPSGGVAAGLRPQSNGAPAADTLLDLGPAVGPSKPAKAPKRPTANPLPFSIADALRTLAVASGGRFVAGESRDMTGGVAVQITAAIRAYPDLAEWQTLGEWLAAGAMPWMPSLVLSWAGSTGLRSGMAASRDWHANGRPAPVGRLPSVGDIDRPGPVSSTEQIQRDGEAAWKVRMAAKEARKQQKAVAQ